MLLRSSSTTALNSLIGVQPKSELNSCRSVQFTQLLVAGNGDGKWVHHDLQPRFVRTASEADLHSPLSSNGSPSGLGLRSGSSSLDLCRTISAESFLSNGLLDEALEEEFEDSDTQISIGFQSAGDPHEESPENIMAAIGIHGGEGRYVSGRRICEGTGVALVDNRAVVVSKTETSFVNGGFGGEDGGGFSGGGGYGGRGGVFGSDPNNTDAYYKKMLQADPGNPLLLANYGRFLQQVNIEESELCFNLIALSCCCITIHLINR
jgi:hypothetical protein